VAQLRCVSATGASVADDLREPDTATEERGGQVVKNDSIE